MRTEKPDRKKSRETAEALAIAALTFIAEDPSGWAFSGAVGIGPNHCARPRANRLSARRDRLCDQ